MLPLELHRGRTRTIYQAAMRRRFLGGILCCCCCCCCFCCTVISVANVVVAAVYFLVFTPFWATASWRFDRNKYFEGQQLNWFALLWLISCTAPLRRVVVVVMSICCNNKRKMNQKMSRAGKKGAKSRWQS